MSLPRLTLKQLHTFAAVAQAGSTAAAAHDLALSQSATSAAVNALEHLLGAPLFDRAGKRLLLNDRGRALLPQALAVLDAAAAIGGSVSANAGDGRHALRIGASTTLGNYLLPGLLAAFFAPAAATPSADAAPPWQARVRIANTAEICRAVADFSLDIGIVEGPCAEPELDARAWLRDELVVVAAPGHALARPGAVLDAPALRAATWLLREPGSGTREVGDAWLLPLLHQYRRSVALDSSEAIKRAAAAGLGLACLSRWAVADFVDSGRLRRLAVPLPPLRRQCFVVQHRARQATPALRALQALLDQQAQASAETDSESGG